MCVWEHYLLENETQLLEHEVFIFPPMCVTEKVVLALKQILKLSSLLPTHFFFKAEVTMSACKQRWGLEGTSVEVMSHSWDV